MQLQLQQQQQQAATTRVGAGGDVLGGDRGKKKEIRLELLVPSAELAHQWAQLLRERAKLEVSDFCFRGEKKHGRSCRDPHWSPG